MRRELYKVEIRSGYTESEMEIRFKKAIAYRFGGVDDHEIR